MLDDTLFLVLVKAEVVQECEKDGKYERSPVRKSPSAKGHQTRPVHSAATI